MTRAKIEALVRKAVLRSFVAQMLVNSITDHDDVGNSVEESTVLHIILNTLPKKELDELAEIGYQADPVVFDQIIRDISDVIERKVPRS